MKVDRDMEIREHEGSNTGLYKSNKKFRSDLDFAKDPAVEGDVGTGPGLPVIDGLLIAYE